MALNDEIKAALDAAFGPGDATLQANRQAMVDAIGNPVGSLVAAAQDAANDAASAASAAQTTADGKNKFSGGAAPHSSPAMNDVWFNGDTTTNCPDNNCLGHTPDGSGVPHVGAYPHRKLWWVHRYNGSAWVDAKGQESIIAADVLAGAITAIAINADSITVKHLRVLSDRDNLWPNPSSEIAPPAGADTTQPEWIDRYSAGGSAYSGSYVRSLAGPAAHGFWLPCSPGARFYAEAMAALPFGTGGARVGISFYPTLGSFSGLLANVVSSSVTAGSWAKVSVTSAAAPAGANAVFIYYEAQSAGDTAFFDALYARRIIAPEIIASEVVTPTAGTGWTVDMVDCRKVGGLIQGLVGATCPAGGGVWSSIMTFPVGARPIGTGPLLTGWVYDSSAATYYPATFNIGSNGVLSVQFYDNGTALVAPFAIGAGDVIRVNVAFPWM